MIQAFPAQQGPQLASILTTVGLLEDLEFIVHGEAASGGFGYHLGIGRQQPGWGGTRNQRRRSTDPSGSLGLALLALAHLRGLYYGKSLLAGSETFHALDLSALYSDLSQGRCLIHIGTEGRGDIVGFYCDTSACHGYLLSR